MTEPRLSTATKALLRAARNDRPSAAARANVWSNVSGTVGGAAGAAAVVGVTTSTGTAVGGASVLKMLLIGTLLGGTVTVGLSSLLLKFGPAPNPLDAMAAAADPLPTIASSGLLGEVDRAESWVAVAESVPDPVPAPWVGTSTAEAPAADVRVASRAPIPTVPLATAAGVARASRTVPPADGDTLDREVALVAEARSALLAGDAKGALRSIRAARALPSQRLIPEELAVEAQALRAAGRDTEAGNAESTLRKQYPESALAR